MVRTSAIVGFAVCAFAAMNYNSAEAAQALRGRKHRARGFKAPSKAELRKHFKQHENLIGGSKNSEEEPNAINWVEMGFATPIKDQGTCNDCYAVSGADMWSARLQHDTDQLFDISAQFSLNCEIGTCHSQPIDGVLQMHDFMSTKSLLTYDQMSLTASKNINADGPLDNPAANCPTSLPLGATNPGNSTTKPVTESLVSNSRLRQIIREHGPSQVGVNFPHGTDSYKCGVFTEKEYPQEKRAVDHMVLIVGYNYTGDDATSYWIVKNSYGSEFGFHGYFAVSMNGPDAEAPTAESDFPGTMSINTVVIYLEGEVDVSENPPNVATPFNPFAEESILCSSSN